MAERRYGKVHFTPQEQQEFALNKRLKPTDALIWAEFALEESEALKAQAALPPDQITHDGGPLTREFRQAYMVERAIQLDGMAHRIMGTCGQELLAEIMQRETPRR